MTHGYGAMGVRCTAMDSLGNRCHKDFTHTAAMPGAERQHDATRGLVERRWL